MVIVTVGKNQTGCTIPWLFDINQPARNFGDIVIGFVI